MFGNPLQALKEEQAAQEEELDGDEAQGKPVVKAGKLSCPNKRLKSLWQVRPSPTYRHHIGWS